MKRSLLVYFAVPGPINVAKADDSASGLSDSESTVVHGSEECSSCSNVMTTDGTVQSPPRSTPPCAKSLVPRLVNDLAARCQKIMHL